jgi:uncharacterized protein YdhG (YjbR/CyaY superfamily)
MAKVKAPQDVAGYLAALPKEQRAALEKIRKTIRSAAPKAEEVISYGIPAFRYNGYGLVWFAAWKDHLSLYPIPRGFQRDLKGYKTAKGTIQFAPDKPLPATLVRKLVRARLAETAKRSKKRA